MFVRSRRQDSSFRSSSLLFALVLPTSSLLNLSISHTDFILDSTQSAFILFVVLQGFVFPPFPYLGRLVVISSRLISPPSLLFLPFHSDENTPGFPKQMGTDSLPKEEEESTVTDTRRDRCPSRRRELDLLLNLERRYLTSLLTIPLIPISSLYIVSLSLSLAWFSFSWVSSSRGRFLHRFFSSSFVHSSLIFTHSLRILSFTIH